MPLVFFKRLCGAFVPASVAHVTRDSNMATQLHQPLYHQKHPPLQQKKEELQQQPQQIEDGKAEGVLLYYHYVNLPQPQQVANWLQEHACKELTGRVRVALDGLNCTLCGPIAALEHHVEMLKSYREVLGDHVTKVWERNPSPK